MRHFTARWLLLLLLFAQVAAVRASLCDVDDNTAQSALSDGLLALRYQRGFRDAALTSRALGNGPGRSAEEIADHLAQNPGFFDLDRNGRMDGLADGLVLLRYQLGFRGEPLTGGLLGADALRRHPATYSALLDFACKGVSLPGMRWYDVLEGVCTECRWGQGSWQQQQQ
ncbi:MAG TPA: hypothetical protein VIX81_00780 [Gammaproteobacteria bacterium]